MDKKLTFAFALALTLVIPAKVIGYSTSKKSDLSYIPGKSTSFIKYEEKAAEICRRNRQSYFPLEKEVIVEFFLTEDGVVRNPRILKSSGSYSHDMSCIDAVLCASPLPKPPFRCSPLTPPINKQNGDLIDLDTKKTILVESLPSGMLTVTFKPDPDSKYRLNNWDSSRLLELPLIPIEMSYKYPEIFNQTELLSAKNYIPVGRALDIKRLERFRYPWVEFIQSNQQPNRKSVLKKTNGYSNLHSARNR